MSPYPIKNIFDYSDKFAHVQVIINCRYSVAQMCILKDMLAQQLGVPCLDDVMSHNELTTIYNSSKHTGFWFQGTTVSIPVGDKKISLKFLSH